MRRRSAEITVAVPTAVALYILNHKRQALAHAESRYGFHVAIGSDDTLVPPAFRLERLRALTPAEIAALPLPTAAVAEVEEEDDDVVGDEGHGRRRRRRRRRGRRDENRDGAMPTPPADEIAAAPEEDDALQPDATPELQAQRSDEPRSEQPRNEPLGPGEQGGDAGGRKRRRRGRRGGRRRRRGEPGQEFVLGEQPAPLADHATPIAESVEYVPATPVRDDAAGEMAEAMNASPAAGTQIESGAESVPVAERGDYAAEPVEPGAVNVPAHEVTRPPANPKRGWWRRVIDS